MCLYPQLIKNPKYKSNQKNGGKIPPIIDNRVLYVPIGCGNCIECLNKKAREWQTRLSEEIKHTRNKYFVTLTYSDQSIATLAKTTNITGYTLDNYIATISVRRFLERWRKEYKTSLKHWLVTELGHNGTENIHLHGILWFEREHDIMQLDKHWQYGYTWKGKELKTRGTITGYENYVNETTIAYISKYVTKIDNQHKHYKPIILTSPGIGKQYIDTPQAKKNKFHMEQTDEAYKTGTGHKIALPIYYRNKLYTEEEREELWLQKLDTETRYVLKQKIDISKETETYEKALKEAREKNKRLGYRTNRKDYNQKKYEEQIREIKQQTRIEKGKKKTKINASGSSSGEG